MTTFLTGDELASYLGVEDTPALDKITELTSNLIDEEWVNPVDPPPAWVMSIAWAVAIRAGSNPKGLTSETRSWDDVTRTQRWEAGVSFGVTLTDDEKARLNSAGDNTAAVAPSSIPVRIPRWDRAPGGVYGGPDYGGGYFP